MIEIKNSIIRVNKEKNKVFLNIKNLLALLIALRALDGVMLAFSAEKYSPIFSKIITLVVYVGVFLSIFFIFTRRRFQRDNIKYLILPIVYWFYLLLHTYKGYKLEWVTVLVVVCCFLLLDGKEKCDTFGMFYGLVQLNNIISLFMYICYILNINIGFEEVCYYTETTMDRGIYYCKWGLFAIYFPGTRLCGIFNEPGGLGTLCALLFIATFKYSKLWEKILLLVTIILTFSFAGYLLIFLFAAFYLVRKNIKNVIWIVAFVALFFILPQIDWGNEDLNYVFSRFEIVDGRFKGDNRTTSEYDYYFDEFMESEDVFLGKGYGYKLPVLYQGGTYKLHIVEFGIIGFGILFAMWFVAGMMCAKKNLDCYILLCFFIVSLYQRPNYIFVVSGYVLLFGGMEWIRENEKIKQLEKVNSSLNDNNSLVEN